MGITSNDIAAQRAMLARGEEKRKADAMLSERDRHHIPDAGKMVENTTNHDAVPEAIARDRDADGGRTDKLTTLPGDGTGNTPAPESYEESDEKRMNTTTNRGIDRRAYEGDIASRLRHWRGLHLAHCGVLFDEAADEIGRLREAIRRLADQDATLSVQGGNVTVTMDATLTDEEREAILNAARAYELDRDEEECAAIAATLRKLLERTK